MSTVLQQKKLSSPLSINNITLRESRRCGVEWGGALTLHTSQSLALSGEMSLSGDMLLYTKAQSACRNMYVEAKEPQLNWVWTSTKKKKVTENPSEWILWFEFHCGTFHSVRSTHNSFNTCTLSGGPAGNLVTMVTRMYQKRPVDHHTHTHSHRHTQTKLHRQTC